jgi:hypothetical protein
MAAGRAKTVHTCWRLARPTHTGISATTDEKTNVSAERPLSTPAGLRAAELRIKIDAVSLRTTVGDSGHPW